MPVVLHPFNQFPAGHKITTNPSCGSNYIKFDPIPAKGYWDDNGKSGDLNSSAPGCNIVTGGELFYSFNYPRSDASSTGLEDYTRDVIYFVEDASGK
jgi:hypothetical protein